MCGFTILTHKHSPQALIVTTRSVTFATALSITRHGCQLQGFPNVRTPPPDFVDLASAQEKKQARPLHGGPCLPDSSKRRLNAEFMAISMENMVFSWFDRLHHSFGRPNDPKFWAILDAWAASKWSKRFQNVNAIGDEWDVLGDVLEFPDCTPRISGYSQFLFSWDTWTISQLSQMVVTFW